VKIDKLSRKILFELDRNSRSSAASIARKLKATEETVRYRLKSLIEHGVISTFYPVVEAGLIGMSVHKLMFKLQKADENKIQEMGEFIRKHPKVNWVARFDGSYDLGCTLWIGRTREVSDFIEELRDRFHNFIKSFSYAVNINAEFFPRDYLVNDRRSSRAAAYSSYKDRRRDIELDHIDWEVLQSVATNARAPITDIAESIGMSGETVQRRLGSLEKRGVISGYRLDMDPERAGVLSYYILLYLNYVSPERMSSMLQYLRAHPHVVYMIKMLGEWDYDLSVEVPDVPAYRSFMLDLTKKFSDVIRDNETLISWKVMKFGIMPPAGK
jgi:Lrp/AsnC family transcriptional regulator, leucine-responsive regulatory protein